LIGARHAGALLEGAPRRQARRPLARLALPGALLLGVLLGAPARAASVEEAVEGAVGLYIQAEFKASLHALQRTLVQARAQPGGGAPRLLGRIHLYIGLNHAVLGTMEEVERDFSEALSKDSTLVLDPSQYKPELVELLDRLRKQLPGELLVVTSPPRLRVKIDGGDPRRTSANGALVVKLAPGSHEVEVLDETGRSVFRTRASIDPGLRTPVSARLDSTRRAPARQSSVTPSSAQSGSREKAPRRHRWLWTYVALGATVAAASVGIGFEASAISLSNAHPECYSPQTQGVGDCIQIRSKVDRRDTVANAMWGVTGGLGAVVAVLFFLEGWVFPKHRAAAKATSSGLELGPLVGPAQVGLRGSF
jgi:hypothetical protein